MVNTRGRLKNKSVGRRRREEEEERLNSALHKIYYNYGHEGALTNTPRLLLDVLRKTSNHPKADEEKVKEFLQRQQSYTVHRRLHKRQFTRRPIRVRGGVHTRTDGDLIELGDLSPWNSGYRYILTLIDDFSRKAYTEPMKTKDSATTAAALERIIKRDGFSSVFLYTDSGKEFLGKPFQATLSKYNIGHRLCTAQEFHCPFVERLNRTLKEKLFQALTASHTRTWLDLLPKIVAGYNESRHSAHNLTPNEAHKPSNVLKTHRVLVSKRSVGRPRRYKFKVGDRVRILREQGKLGDKGYLPKFTWEVFIIHKLANDRYPDDAPTAVPAYILRDLKDEIIEHSLFYEPELSLVRENKYQPQPIREVLEQRGDKIKVWWQGFPKSQAEWISRSAVNQKKKV